MYPGIVNPEFDGFEFLQAIFSDYQISKEPGGRFYNLTTNEKKMLEKFIEIWPSCILHLDYAALKMQEKNEIRKNNSHNRNSR